MRANTIKLLDEILGVNLYDLGLGSAFLNKWHQKHKHWKINWVSSWLKTSVLPRIPQEGKRQPIEWEKMFANHIPSERRTCT